MRFGVSREREPSSVCASVLNAPGPSPCATMAPLFERRWAHPATPPCAIASRITMCPEDGIVRVLQFFCELNISVTSIPLFGSLRVGLGFDGSAHRRSGRARPNWHAPIGTPQYGRTCRSDCSQGSISSSCANNLVRSATRSFSTGKCGRGVMRLAPFSRLSMGVRQAKPLWPSMFIAHEPNTPSRQDRRNAG
jgi:hypothetical protein